MACNLLTIDLSPVISADEFLGIQPIPENILKLSLTTVL